jgi:hypothetical protein
MSKLLEIESESKVRQRNISELPATEILDYDTNEHEFNKR